MLNGVQNRFESWMSLPGRLRRDQIRIMAAVLWVKGSACWPWNLTSQIRALRTSQRCVQCICVSLEVDLRAVTSWKIRKLLNLREWVVAKYKLAKHNPFKYFQTLQIMVITHYNDRNFVWLFPSVFVFSVVRATAMKWQRRFSFGLSLFDCTALVPPECCTSCSFQEELAECIRHKHNCLVWAARLESPISVVSGTLSRSTPHHSLTLI